MKHPKQRAERRSVRRGWIARRRYIIEHVWRDRGWRKPKWGMYAKWNLNCGCMMCHCNKYFKEKRKRRRALDQAITLNLRSWGL